jgi:hypothetical protein
MKYFIFTYSGHGLPLAMHLQHEGREVLVGQVEKKAEVLCSIEKNQDMEDEGKKDRRLSLYEGLIPKMSADDLVNHLLKEKHPEECFVFFDINNLFHYADKLRDKGFHGNFPTEDNVLLEVDRARAKSVVDENYPKLQSAMTKKFKKAKEAISFLETTGELWVLKGEDDLARVVVPTVTDITMASHQLIQELSGNPHAYESSGFILELYVPHLIELTPEKIYYNGKPVCTTVDIENKPMGSGNIGPQTGCSQDLVFATDLRAPINEIAFPAWVDELAKNHEGLFVWDASLLIDERTGSMYFGEYCPNRFGYNSLLTECALAGSVSSFFEALVVGRNPFSPDAVGVSVRLFNYLEDENGLALAGRGVEYNTEAKDSLWLWDVKSSKNGAVTCGLDKNLGVATGVGHSVEEAAKKAYDSIENFSFEGIYYRPMFDLLSTQYSSSLMNRLTYGLKNNLYKANFKHTA